MTTPNTASVRPTDLPPGFVAIPTTDLMPARSAAALAKMLRTVPPGSVIRWDHDPHIYSAKRNAAVESFLAEPTLEWLLMLDSDMAPPWFTLLRLWGHNLDVVGGLYFERHPPYGPSGGELRPGVSEADALTRWDELARDGMLVSLANIGADDAPREVVWCGGGCILIRRRVLEAMAGGWFDSPSRTGRAEDIAFCLRARANGFRMFLDTGFCVPHWGLQSVGVPYGPDVSTGRDPPHRRCL